MSETSRKQFDFTKFKQRHIALKIIYFGWDYDGLAAQQDNENTIEFHLFSALIKTCLIKSRAECHYNRCGRTDKGVSSVGQVVDFNIRSNLTDEEDSRNIGLFTPVGYSGEDTVSDRQELRYVDILNRVLPDHIKVIAWAPVGRKDFSSRFSCISRSYSYIFPLGDLDLDAMRESLRYLVGEHDFRNLCSFDLKNGVTNHKRTILFAQIQPCQGFDKNDDSTSRYSFYEVIICGKAFLYHQIRCIMSIIFLVGTKKESPEVVRDLLDTKVCSAKPNYNKADPMPLCLFGCDYEPDDLPLGWNFDGVLNLQIQLKSLWRKYKTKTTLIERALMSLDQSLKMDLELCTEPLAKKTKSEPDQWKHFGLQCDNMSDTKYIPLLKRPRDETLESKLEAFESKAKNCSS